MVKFHGKLNSSSLDALTRCLDPEMGHKGLIGAKKNLKFELGEKLDHRFTVQFCDESNGDITESLKRCWDPELGHKGQIWGAKFEI